MEIAASIIEPLLERAGAYGKTSIELARLKSMDKLADISSTMFSRLLQVLMVSFFIFGLNIAIALWLGEMLGKNYYGFLIIASFYAIAGIILFMVHPSIKARLNNSLIQILN
jgi:membrane-associated HD superfamily phosphohydrolase